MSEKLTHPVIRAWVAQLYRPEIIQFLEQNSDKYIDVTLFAAQGKAVKGIRLTVHVENPLKKKSDLDITLPTDV